jgi:hypothetical protein
MRLNYNLLTKFSGTLTVPAAETGSIGLPANLPTGRQARWRHVFCSPSGQFYRDMTNPAHLSGPRHLDSFIVTPNAHPSIGTLQKRMPTLTRTATKLNRRAVRLSKNLLYLLITMRPVILPKKPGFVS